ncbi:unnamed protein product, partial [Amoebophrya sp. A120]
SEKVKYSVEAAGKLPSSARGRPNCNAQPAQEPENV